MQSPIVKNTKPVISVIISLLAGGLFYYYQTFQPENWLTFATLFINTNLPSLNFDVEKISASRQLTHTYSKLIKKDSTLKNVIEKLNLPTTAKELSKIINVHVFPSTQLVRIYVSHQNPELAAEIASELAADITKESVGISNNQEVIVSQIDDAGQNTVRVPPNKLQIFYLSILIAIGLFWVLFELLRKFTPNI